MEKEKVLEQPSVDQTIPTVENTDKNEVENNDGSLLGKFNSVKDLEMAYENLQKEFTKKCQKLSEVEKKLPKQSDNETKISPQNDINWEQEVDKFLTDNKLAKENILEISEEIIKTPALANSFNGLEQALNKVLAKKYKPVDEIVKDEVFLENNIYNNEKIKQKIIEDYLVQITSNKVSPLIGEHVGSGIATMPKTKPSTFQEAGELVSRLIKG